jgi:hypothetical protein
MHPCLLGTWDHTIGSSPDATRLYSLPRAPTDAIVRAQEPWDENAALSEHWPPRPLPLARPPPLPPLRQPLTPSGGTRPAREGPRPSEKVSRDPAPLQDIAEDLIFNIGHGRALPKQEHIERTRSREIPPPSKISLKI